MSSLQTNSYCRSGYWKDQQTQLSGTRPVLSHIRICAPFPLKPGLNLSRSPMFHRPTHLDSTQLPLVSQRDHEGNKEEELRLRERSHVDPEVQRCAETTHKPEIMSKASARVCKPKLCWDKKRTCLVHMKINNSVFIYLPSFHCKPLWLSVFYEHTQKTDDIWAHWV